MINSVAIGTQAGYETQGSGSIGIGRLSGGTSQANYATAIGYYAGTSNQEQYGIALGYEAGFSTQKTRAVAIGVGAGYANQGQDGVGIGYQAGRSNQGFAALAFGSRAGWSNQSTACIAIGTDAGFSNQRPYSIALGYQAGNSNQGRNSIAIGANAGYSSQAPSSIVMSALFSTLNVQDSGFYVAPLRTITGSNTNTLGYNSNTAEIGLIANASGGATSINFTVSSLGAGNVQFFSEDSGKFFYYTGTSGNSVDMPAASNGWNVYISLGSNASGGPLSLNTTSGDVLNAGAKGYLASDGVGFYFI